MVKDIKRLNIVIVVVCAHDNKILDAFCKALNSNFENHSVYIRQYFTKMTPLRSLIKRQMKENPGLQLIVIGNTNDKFGGEQQYDELFDRCKHPYMNAGIIDLRGAEDTGVGKQLKLALKETLDYTIECTAKDLVELIEKN